MAFVKFKSLFIQVYKINSFLVFFEITKVLIQTLKFNIICEIEVTINMQVSQKWDTFIFFLKITQVLIQSCRAKRQ